MTLEKLELITQLEKNFVNFDVELIPVDAADYGFPLEHVKLKLTISESIEKLTDEQIAAMLLKVKP